MANGIIGIGKIGAFIIGKGKDPPTPPFQYGDEFGDDYGAIHEDGVDHIATGLDRNLEQDK